MTSRRPGSHRRKWDGRCDAHQTAPMPAGADGIPTGRIGRGVPLARLASVNTAARLAGWARRGGDAKELARFTKEAQRYVATLGEMKGAAMKVGQILSFLDSNLVPEAYRPIYQEIAGALQADATPMPVGTARAVIEEELGRPVDEVFEWFGQQPMAAASIGQVHAAHLAGGREVVVKVQYPGAAAAVRADLANAHLMASIASASSRLLGPLRPVADPRAMVDEIRDRVGEELDYRIEAANLQEFGDRYRDHPFIRIPDVVPELCTERVLVMDEVDGMRWQVALEQPQHLKDRWGEVINRFVYGSLYEFGIFNADPHPGNYLFHDDGAVTFLDFGCVKRFTPAQVEGARTFSESITRGAGDPDALKLMLIDQGFLPANTKLDAERIFEWYAPMYRPVVEEETGTYTPELAATVVHRNFDPLGEFGDMMRGMGITERSKDFVFINRIQLGLFSILGGLRATGPWRAIAAEVTWADPPQTDLGRQHAAWKASGGGGDRLPSPDGR
jgi:predicted unusual protein kinase regulating ubiquinone biosynthesis (AarF/ABC1/UbiB family)